MEYNNKVNPIKVNASTRVSAEFSGPTGHRECRDIVFLIVFIIFTSGMIYVAYRGLSMGNPYRIVYGTDSWGNVCNEDNPVIPGVKSTRTGLSMSSKPYLFYFNESVFSSMIDSALGNIHSVKICVSKCPVDTISTVTELQSSEVQLCVYDLPISGYFNGNANGLSDCPHLPIQKHEAFLFRCIPTTLTKRINHIVDAINDLLDTFEDNLVEKGASDIRNSWFEMLVLCALAVVVSIIVTLLIQFMAAIIVWLMVAALAVGSIIATGVTWYHYNDVSVKMKSTPLEERTAQMEKTVRDWLTGACCVTAITVVLLLVLVALRKYIKLVVELFQQAGVATRQMPSLLVHPLITVLFLGGALGGLSYIFLYIETSGTNKVDSSTGFVNYELDKVLLILKWYHIFGMIWIVQFIIACHKISVAGAVSIWYFTHDKGSLSFPVVKSTWNVFRYHLGSLAFGSLLITFVMFVRMVMSFIETRLKGKTNPVAIFLLKCFKCCLWCFEKFLKFLNNNAYIEIAIYGYGFCKAARQAFHVIIKNAMNLAAINSVGDFVLFLGKLSVVAIVTVVGIAWISARESINFVWLPVTLTAICSYFIASGFISVYEMTIDTIFLCFCEDCAMNDGDTRPYYMSVGLQKCLTSRLEDEKSVPIEESHTQ